MGIFQDRYNLLTQQRAEITVPEWGISFFVGPLTFSQFQNIMKAERVSGPTESLYTYLELCAKKEDGTPLLVPVELLEMRNYGEAEVVARVARQIKEAHNTFHEEDDEKKA